MERFSRIFYLNGVWHEIFDFRFFHESVSPGPLNMPVQIFTKILGDMQKYKLITEVIDIGEKWKTVEKERFFIFCWDDVAVQITLL